jgi:hypothetical protein
MRTTAFALSTAALAAAASAQQPTAQITIEASHGGAGNGLTNKTVEVPIGPVYTNAEALGEVSTLYLTGATGVPVEHVTCTPYHAATGEGSGGRPFTSTTPSRLSTNTVQVGSIQCVGWDTAKVRRAPALPPFVRRDNGTAPAGAAGGNSTSSDGPSKTGSSSNSTKTDSSSSSKTSGGSSSSDDSSNPKGTESPDSGAALLSVSSAALFGVMGLMFVAM